MTGIVNPNIVFHLSKGNPFNDPVGITIDDRSVFGKSLGGQIFTTQTFLTGQSVSHTLKTGTSQVFDPIVLSDMVKNKVNYRAVYILNPSSDHVILDNIAVSLQKSDYLDFAICEFDIATEGFYTLGELNRPIPKTYGNIENPSLYIDDEYDSTNKLQGLVFKKTLDADDLPADIPTNCALKIWIRRKCIVDRNLIPDGEFWETAKLIVNEYNDEYSTPFEITYFKEDGRIPLSNWYDYTITPGKGNSIVLKELIPKEVDLTTVTPINTFVKNDKVLLFYSTEIADVINYHLLVVEPHDTLTKNKYIHIQMNFSNATDATETLKSRELVNIFKSNYNPDEYYFFWKDVVTTTGTNNQYFGIDSQYDRIQVDTIKTLMWTSSASFESVPSGYEYRRIVSLSPVNTKTVRDYTQIVNVEQFDDLFIIFAKDTQSSDILSVPGLNLNKNELLYVFEKDIISSSNNSFNTLPGNGAEVLSHRLYPTSLQKEKLITCFNVAKNSSSSAIFSDNLNISKSLDANRTIKTLLDGTRYVDYNSFHNREYKIGKNFTTYELPNNKNLTSLLVNLNISIANDSDIYEYISPSFTTSNVMSNIIDNVTYEKPWFQKNIIDANNIQSLSIPLEWVDRVYKDKWFTILSSAPNENNVPQVKVQYNFAKNLWQAVWNDENGIENNKVYDYLYGQTFSTTAQPATASSVSTTGSTGSAEFGKAYKDLSLLDIPYVLELGTYQPFSVKVSSQQVYGNNNIAKYKIKYQVFFKGNENPIIDISFNTYDISSLSYVFVNLEKSYSVNINYLDVNDGKLAPVEFTVKNLHKACLNQLQVNISKEYKVNRQVTPSVADFRYYRKIDIANLQDATKYSDKSVVVPIVLYGNGYSGTLDLENINVPYPFDFKKLAINDKSMRFYFDSALNTPIYFKVGAYDYANEWAVLWVMLDNMIGTNKTLYLYYDKVNIAESKTNIRSQYVSLKSNLMPTWCVGAWFFDTQYIDERLSFADGKIFNAGEPIIYEKRDNEVSLSQIDKEYMYGLAKIYKSHKFNIEIEAPAEESLFFDEKSKQSFINFIKDTATLLKPSYTEIYNVKQYGFDILEAGEVSMGETTNKRVAGLVATTPNANVSTYYDRINDNKFNILTSFNGFSKSIDWVISKPIDTPIFKSGVYKVNGKLKSDVINFETPFKDNNYYIFLSSPSNQKIYWQLLCNNRFTITASHYLLKEVCWMAFHKDIFGGVYTPNSIYVGRRDITGSVETSGGEAPTTANLDYWYNHELLIKPEVGIADDASMMTISETDPGYSLILSSNENINIYWNKKEYNQFSIKTSSPVATTVHWLVIRNGVEWWQEIQ